MVPANPRVLARMLTPRRHRDPDYARSIAGEIYGGTMRTHPERAAAGPALGDPTRPAARLLLPAGRQHRLEQPAVPQADPAADADRRRGRRPDRPGRERPDHGAAAPRRPAARLRGRAHRADHRGRRARAGDREVPGRLRPGSRDRARRSVRPRGDASALPTIRCAVTPQRRPPDTTPAAPPGKAPRRARRLPARLRAPRRADAPPAARRSGCDPAAADLTRPPLTSGDQAASADDVTAGPPRASTRKPRSRSTSATARFMTCCTSASAVAPCTWSTLIRSCWRQVTTIPPSAGSRGQAGAADLAVRAGGVVQGQPGLRQRAGDLDDQGGQRVVVGERLVPVVGQALELLTQVSEPRPVLRRRLAASGRRPRGGTRRPAGRPRDRRGGRYRRPSRASARSGKGPETIRAGTVRPRRRRATSPGRLFRRQEPHCWTDRPQHSPIPLQVHTVAGEGRQQPPSRGGCLKGRWPGARIGAPATGCNAAFPNRCLARRHGHRDQPQRAPTCRQLDPG